MNCAGNGEWVIGEPRRRRLQGESCLWRLRWQGSRLQLWRHLMRVMQSVLSSQRTKRTGTSHTPCLKKQAKLFLA